jgi:hypothetical protein
MMFYYKYIRQKHEPCETKVRIRSFIEVLASPRGLIRIKRVLRVVDSTVFDLI